MPKRLGNCALEEMSSKSRGALPYSTWRRGEVGSTSLVQVGKPACPQRNQTQCRPRFVLAAKKSAGVLHNDGQTDFSSLSNGGWAPTREGGEESEKRRWSAIDRNQQRFTRDFGLEMPSHTLHHGAKVACRCHSVRSPQRGEGCWGLFRTLQDERPSRLPH